MKECLDQVNISFKPVLVMCLKHALTNKNVYLFRKIYLPMSLVIDHLPSGEAVMFRVSVTLKIIGKTKGGIPMAVRKDLNSSLKLTS